MTPTTKQKLSGTSVAAVLVDELEDLGRQLLVLRDQAEPPPAALSTRQQRRKAERLAAKRRRGAK